MQILIQSIKENLSQNFNNLKEISQKEENEKIKEVNKKYLEYIKNKNENNKSSSKNFYIIVSYENENTEKNNVDKEMTEKIAFNYLNECYLKIKESLSRCGNTVYDINSKKETEEFLNSFFTSKK